MFFCASFFNIFGTASPTEEIERQSMQLLFSLFGQRHAYVTDDHLRRTPVQSWDSLPRIPLRQSRVEEKNFGKHRNSINLRSLRKFRQCLRRRGVSLPLLL
jgi:hypothetical protein